MDQKRTWFWLALAAPLAFAQDASGNLFTPGATAWFVAVAGLAVLGVPFTRRAVAFVLERSWGKWFDVGDRPILLSFVFALGWTLFVFQPGVLDISAFKLLPAWQAILFTSVSIALGASGGVDAETRARRGS